jgi:hypothetical protein
MADPHAAASWREREPDDPVDAVPHLATQTLAGSHGCRMMAASRRGKQHAQEGRYRDDAFALAALDEWLLIAVADGAGSHAHSRIGAHVAAEGAITGMRAAITDARDPLDVLPMQQWSASQLRECALAAIHAADAAVRGAAVLRQWDVRDLSCTLLAVALHVTAAGGCDLAIAQIGDGMILSVEPDGTAMELAAADVGIYAGETVFLTGLAQTAWYEHCYAAQPATPPALLLIMTDGVADDLTPLDRQLPTLLGGIREALRKPQPEEALAAMLAYDKRASFDDRTLVVVTQEGAPE